jgi:S-phase kinase-associated protein 1
MDGETLRAAPVAPPEVVESLDDPCRERKTIELRAPGDAAGFAVRRDYAVVSQLVKTILEDDPTATTIACPDVEADVLALVAEYIDHHAGKDAKHLEMPLGQLAFTDLVEDPWDADFLQRVATEKNRLYRLARAANYLDISGLLYLSCAYIASLVRGKPAGMIPRLLENV